MELDQLKKVWDEKNQSHIYTIDEEVLRLRAINSNNRIRRMVSVFEWSMFSIILLLSIVMIVEGIIDNELYQLPEGILLLMVSCYVYWERIKRIRIQKPFSKSIIENIDQSIQILEYQIRRQRNVIWWFILPITVTTIYHAVYTFEGKPWWIWLFTALSFFVSYLIILRESRNKLLPKKHELEALKKLLQE